LVELIDPVGDLHLVRVRVRGRLRLRLRLRLRGRLRLRLRLRVRVRVRLRVRLRVRVRDRVDPFGDLHLQLPLVEAASRVSTRLEAAQAWEAGQVEQVRELVGQAEVELERGE
jgi:hypothetical protein